MRKSILLTAALALAILASAQVWAQRTEPPILAARPLSTQEIRDYGLPEDLQKSSGLFTVAVGTPAYLEVRVGNAVVATSEVTWTLSGPGSAALETSPLAIDVVPIYTPGRAGAHKVLSRKLLRPDVEGQWRITATFTTETTVNDVPQSETITLEEVVTAATWVGVANCTICHMKSPPLTGTEDGPAALWPDTRHATKLQREISGLGSDHYGPNCIQCHTVGYDTNPAAVNGGFDDVAASVGWTFPVDDEGQPILAPENWENMPDALKAKANVQCENCHGPGSQHNGNKADNRISVSLNPGNCGFCHDQLSAHPRNAMWRESAHADNYRGGSGEGREACAVCHNGFGFIERIDKDIDVTLFPDGYLDQVTNTDWETIGCATCHDPHEAGEEHPHQLRKVDEVKLINGLVITEGGHGTLCMQCHRARDGGVEYAEVYHRRHRPHHNNQTDMLVGANAVEYGEYIRKSTHLYAVENTCVGCHMQEIPRRLSDGSDNPLYTQVGNHTWKMSYGNGTPDDHSDDIDQTAPCVDCHGPMQSFDIPKSDYDGDGKVEGVQTEIEGLMEILAKALPPVGQNAIAITEDFTVKQLQATYNHNFVLEDGSHGIHNVQYAVGILKASIKDLTGRTVAAGGTVRVLQGGVARGGLVASGAPAGKMVPGRYELYQNAPNPFNPETEIRYAVPEPVDVRVEIYNSLGQQVRTLVDAHHAPGEYSATWNGRDADGQQVTAGMYIYHLEAGRFTGSGKMVLLP